MAEETDSGVGSMPDSSKDCTPEKKRRVSSSFDEDVSKLIFYFVCFVFSSMLNSYGNIYHLVLFNN